MSARTPPKGLQTAGRRLWRAVVAKHHLERHEADLLVQAWRTVDLLDRLAEAAAEAPLVLDGKANPLLVEHRQQAITAARLLAALRLPVPDVGRPQKRTGARGVYQAARRAGADGPPPAPAGGNVASLDERRAQLVEDGT